jgi:release factor glutamine methyltransferase
VTSLLTVLRQTEQYLADKGIVSARVESEWLIGHALELSRLQVYMQFERPLTDEELCSIRPLLRRRAVGEPLQYITGQAPFYDSEFAVGPGVLIPRPETERLVEIALSKHEGGDVLDLCTGSGAIIFSMARACLDSDASFVGSDISNEALAWALRNQETLGLPDVELLQGDLFEPVAGRRFTMITANPPYVSTTECAELPAEIADHEPELALAAGADGLDILRRIADSALDYLEPAGWLLCEIGAGQGAAAAALFAENWQAVEVVKDYNERDRIVIAQAK